MNDSGMRLHLRCTPKKNKKGNVRRPRKWDFEDHRGMTNIYDVGLKELRVVKRTFAKIEVISFGKFEGTKNEWPARNILGLKDPNT